MGSLVLGGATAYRQFCVLSRCFSTTGSSAKKSTKKVHKTALKHYPGLARDRESRESRGNHLCSDEDGLNEEQRTFFDLVVKQGKSVFFTGPAGTGKSVLLKKIIRSLATKYLGESKCVGVTASTGLAAHNIGGTTLHRFAGIGLGQAPTEKLIRDILKTKIKLQRWRLAYIRHRARHCTVLR